MPPSTPEMSVAERSLTIERPPHTILGILSRLGPGLIIAGSIVGSGELIATTRTGAEAGFWLLWLIIIGCVIKVFVQVELGRDAITRGKSTMDALSEIPGPHIPGRGNWLVWYWFVMWLAMTAQLGGIAGSVGQAMAVTWPLTEEGRTFNTHLDRLTENAKNLTIARNVAKREGRTEESDPRVIELEAIKKELSQVPTSGYDEKIWTTIIALITTVLLIVGRYGFVQNSTTALVAIFTLVTVGTVIALQFTPDWAIGWNDVWQGLQFRLPPTTNTGASPLATALKTFGIIGVGASELVAYPYWCLEKGYARFAGPRDASKEWADRAKGWLRVLQWDVWCSMAVYTTATLAFYFLGAAILGRTGLVPADSELIRTLNLMYEPVFGPAAKSMFLIGAFAVLYSTFFVATAGNARICADAVGVIGLADRSEAKTRRRVIWLSGGFPILSLFLYFGFTWLTGKSSPDQLVLFSGMVQAFMLPMLAVAALYFRYRTCDSRLIPGPIWTALLWISSLGMLVAAAFLGYGEIVKLLK